MMTMRTGQYFRLNHDTLAVDKGNGKPTLVTVPTGAIICATGAQNPDDPRMIELQWQDCRLFMFAVDVQERGERLWQPQKLDNGQVLEPLDLRDPGCRPNVETQ